MSRASTDSVAVVTFANIGKKANLKTADIAPVIETFNRAGVLSQVICQVAQASLFPRTYAAYPAPVRFIVRLGEMLSGRYMSREWTESIVDHIAAWYLKNTKVVIFHPALFPRTVKKARRQGSVVVGIAASAHPLFAERLYSEEIERLGLPQHQYPESLPQKIVADRYDYIIASSAFAKETYVQFGVSADKVYVAEIDVDTERFRPDILESRNQEFTVLYAAYTTPLKGLGYLLDAWEAFPRRDARLVIMGGYGEMPISLRERYDARIHSDSRIVTVPAVADPEKWYKKATCLVFPSLTEGFGRVTLEAMACGIPVITTENARGIVEDGKTGFVVPIRDAHAISEKFSYLYHNREVVKEMGIEARRAVEQKVPFGEAVYDIYQDILRKEKLHFNETQD